ncbi:MAG: GNAT family N-acetyltransferase [Actinomycetota bacterium]|jgi:predicted N-acyltransferase|nr:GNAT family N-acetyltransferase [Actinomycetota bacterium]
MMRVERLRGIEGVNREEWRALEPPEFPFFDFEFLRALERSGSIGRRSGWSPAYLVCKEGGRILGALCLYSKTDSYGEYIFDWEWARAYQQYGLPYYPKLVVAVPFTPATGPKLLVRFDVDDPTRTRVKRALLEAAEDVGTEYGVSSSHALFVPEEELGEFSRLGFTVRHSLQFHWHNRGYETFSDYLGALSGKRRRQISRERRQLEDEGLEILHLTGDDLLPHHAALMHRFYLSTLDGKWGVPYLNRAFFDEIFETMKDRTLLVLARDGAGLSVAGALFFLKDRSLFGRYWGTVQQRRNLHFELCYYQGIDFAIERGFNLFEAGAQGEHKLARGFLPSLTYSAHKIRDPAFGRAIGEYIESEKEMLAYSMKEYASHDPFRR